MAHNQQYDTANKMQARNIAMVLQTKVKAFLCFPARECLDLKQALKAGKINKNTIIYAIEKDWEDREIIKNFLSKHFSEFYVFTNLKSFMKKCTNKDNYLPVPNFIKIDLAYIDVCGCAKETFIEDLNNIRYLFDNECQVSVTTYSVNRGCNNYVNDKGSKLMKTNSYIPYYYYKTIDCSHFSEKEKSSAVKHQVLIANALGFRSHQLNVKIMYVRDDSSVPMFVHGWQR